MTGHFGVITVILAGAAVRKTHMSGFSRKHYFPLICNSISYLAITGSLAPILQSSSLLMLPELSATTGTDNLSYPSAPASVTMSPTDTPSVSVISTAS